MTPQDQQTYQRGAWAALIGLIVQLALAVALVLIGLWAASGDGGGDTRALHPATYHLLGGLLIWAILWLIYVQHRQERAEALESEQLARADAGTAAIFEEHAQDLHLARRRLDNLYKWGLNLVSIVVAAYLLTLGGLWLYWNARALQPLQQEDKALPLLAMCVSIAFVAFVVARWVAGMTKVPAWQLLRGGASYLMGSALVAALAAIAAACHWLGWDDAFAALGVVVPMFMLLVGLEMVISFALGVYRPRRPGELPRPAFDSRVLGLLTTPESIAKAIGDTINYQFGFEVSRSWFYRLLSQALAPLVAVALLILIGLSSILVVEPHEQAVVTRFGRLLADPIRDPGLHLKWPWPISRARAYPVARVQSVSAGSVRGFMDRNRPILWTTAHTTQDEEYLLTAATPHALTDQPEEVERLAGMGLVAANVRVMFRIKDLRQFVSNVPEPWRLIRAMRQRQEWDEMTRSWEAGGRAGADPLAADAVTQRIIDPCPLLTAIASRQVSAYYMQQDVEDALLGSGAHVSADLQARIQAEVDARALGIEVVFVSVDGIHPPLQGDVAAAFHEQVGALQDRKTKVEDAQRQAIDILTRVAGRPDAARALHQLISARTRGGAAPEMDAEIYAALQRSGGDARQELYNAETYRWRQDALEGARAVQFQAMLDGYRQAPRYFQARLYLEAQAEALADARKYLVPVRPDQYPEYWLDLKMPELDFIGALERDNR